MEQYHGGTFVGICCFRGTLRKQERDFKRPIGHSLAPLDAERNEHLFSGKNDLRDIIIQPIDSVDDNYELQEPGRFILSRFAPSAISIGYREKSKVTIQDYISQKGVIKNQIIWVKGLSGKTTEQWVKF